MAVREPAISRQADLSAQLAQSRMRFQQRIPERFFAQGSGARDHAFSRAGLRARGAEKKNTQNSGRFGALLRMSRHEIKIEEIPGCPKDRTGC